MLPLHRLLATIAIVTALPARAEVFATVGARALGMGGAFVAICNDGTAVHYNPAGLFLEPRLMETIVGNLSESESEDFMDALSGVRGTDILSPAVYDDPEEVARLVARLRKLDAEGAGVIGGTGFGLYGGKQVHGASLEIVDFAHAWADVDLVHGSPGRNPETGFAVNGSKLHTTGIQAREVIYTFSHNFFSASFIVGLNLKYMDVRTYASETSVFGDAPSDRGNLIDAAFDLGKQKDKGYTADLGFIYVLTQRAKLGVVGKYLTGPDFDATTPTGKLSIDPQVRGGLSYVFGKWVYGDVDLDLTSNDTGVPDRKERQAAAGLEWWVGSKRSFAIRGGVHGNLASGGLSPVAALGFGYRAPHVMLDVGGEFLNPDETKIAITFSLLR